MNPRYYCRHFDLAMLWLSCLLELSAVGILYVYITTDVVLEELLIVWCITSILLSELTLLDGLRNRRIRKKVFFTFLLHFIPILSLPAYWWWKIRWKTQGNGGSSKNRQSSLNMTIRKSD